MASSLLSSMEEEVEKLEKEINQLEMPSTDWREPSWRRWFVESIPQKKERLRLLKQELSRNERKAGVFLVKNPHKPFVRINNKKETSSQRRERIRMEKELLENGLRVR